MTSTNLKLDYLFVGGRPFSLAVEDSDHYQSQILLAPLVGTLVKPGPCGDAEPYLASHWAIDATGLIYKFSLRSNLACSDGYPLTATNFAKCLINRLEVYAEANGGVLEFEKLAGWPKCGNAIAIEEDRNQLTLTFASKPHDLMNILRMPYFGFYSPANFNLDGRSRDKHNVISCGPFEIKSASDSHVTVVRRPRWFTAQDVQVEEVHFRREMKMPVASPPTPQIIDSGLVAETVTPTGFKKILGPPEILLNVVLNSTFKVFRSVETRRWLAHQIFRHRHQLVEGLEDMTPTDSFTTDEVPEPPKIVSPAPAWEAKIVSAYLSPNLSNVFSARVKSMLDSIFGAQGLTVEFPEINLLEKGEALTKNKLVDIRVGGVSIGNEFHPSAYRMMFGSELGVCYPDPSGAIRRLINEFEKGEVNDMVFYGARVANLIAQDAAVIPLAWKSMSWFYSDDIDYKLIQFSPNYPRFDLLRISKSI